MATSRPTYGPILLLIVLCIVQLSCNNADSNGDILNCFNETINSVVRWNISIDDQEELDKFIGNATSTNDDKDRCIQLFLTGESYTLDVMKIMGIKLGTGGGLVIVGVANNAPVTINCVATSNAISDSEELINNSTLVTKVSLVVLDGLLFTGCPVPVVLEEVSTVIVQNCVFM